MCDLTSGVSLGPRHLSTTHVNSNSTPSLASQPQNSSSAEQRSFEFASPSDTVKREWGAVAKDPSLVYVRREPWDDSAIFPFSAKAFYVGKTPLSPIRMMCILLLLSPPLTKPRVQMVTGCLPDPAGKGLSTQLKALYATAKKSNYSTVWATQDSRMLCLSPLSQWQSSSEEDRRKVPTVASQ